MASHYICRHSTAMLQRAATCSRRLGPCLPTLSAASRRSLQSMALGNCNEPAGVLQTTRRAPLQMPHHYSTGTASLSPSSPSIGSATASQPLVHHIFEKVTGTWQYIVADPTTAAAAIIDPVLDFDPSTGELRTDSADALLSIVKENGYKVQRILETHIHADHVTAAAYLQHVLRDDQGQAPSIGIGMRIETVQKYFQKLYGIPDDEICDVHQCLFQDDETFHIGDLEVQAIHLPGHTPDHMGYKMGDNIFCGDSLFAADLGSSRCDFPGGSAKALYESGRKLLRFPDRVRIWSGHDYPSAERSEPVPYQSVGEHRRSNKHLMKDITQEDFVAMRERRDATLKEPRLLHQSLQFNVRGGRLPKMASGRRMIKTPITAVNGGW